MIIVEGERGGKGDGVLVIFLSAKLTLLFTYWLKQVK